MTDDEKRYPLAVARVVASALVHHLSPFAERISIAGSVRRERQWVKDAEIVMVPKVRYVERDLFGNDGKAIRYDTSEGIDAYNRIERFPMEVRDVESKDGEIRRIDGDRFKALVDTHTGLPIDLFIVLPPATWGCIYFIRTGPADFNKRAMKRAHAMGMQFDQGRLIMQASRRPLPTPEEEDVFRHLKANYKDPEDRK